MYCVIIYEQRQPLSKHINQYCPARQLCLAAWPGDVIASPPSLPNSAYRNFNHGIHENYDHIKEQIISSAVCIPLYLYHYGLHFNKSSS